MTTTTLPSVQLVSFILQRHGFVLKTSEWFILRGLSYLPGNAQQIACSSNLADFKQLQIIGMFMLIAERSCYALESGRTKG